MPGDPEEAYALDQAKSWQKGGNNGRPVQFGDLNAKGTCALSMVKAEEGRKTPGFPVPSLLWEQKMHHLFCL